MPGTKEGARNAVKTIKAKYGADYFARIGRKGGNLGSTGGFGAGDEGRERARTAGRKGGLVTKAKYHQAKAASDSVEAETGYARHTDLSVQDLIQAGIDRDRARYAKGDSA